MKKIFSVILFIFLFIINVNAEVSVSYDNAVKTSQRYIYKFNKYDKYLLTDKKYIELKGSDTAIIPFGFKNNKLEVNSDFTRGGLLNEEEFNLSKDSNGSTYLSQDVEFFLIGKKAVNTLNNEVIDAGDKKYGIRVTEFVLPGTKTRGSGTKVNPWEFVGTYKLTFYINNGKITNNGLSVNKYIVYAVESTEGQIIVNFEPNSGFEYLRNNCNFTYEYDKTNKIHKIYKDNKDINSDQDCTIDLKTGSFIVEYDYNGGNGKCENLAVPKGNKISKLCTNVSREGYTFKGWQDEKGNTVTNDTVVNGNIKLIAQWEIKKATLTINPNGGIWNNTTSNSTKTGTINSTLSIANPTPKGYTVSFNSNGGNNVNSITSQRTFTNWSLSGSGSMSGTTYTFGSGNATLTANYNNGSITLPSTTAAGYKFKGWYSNGCDTTFIGNAGESYTPTSNVTLKACYHYYAYILDVYPNGGTWNGTTKMTRINPLANPKPSIYGNTDYTGKIYSTIDIPNPIPPSGYTVSFNTNGGSSVGSITSTKSFNGWNNSSPGTFSGTTYTYGEGSGYITANYKNNSVKLPKPTKSGYTFDGWYTASSGGTYVGTSGSYYSPTSNIKLYAHWSSNASTSYTLTVNPNGGIWNGTTSSSSFTASSGSTKIISNPTPPSGYTVSFNANGGNSVSSKTASSSFDYWYKSGAGSLSGTTFTYGSGNTSLTARYTINSITLPSTSKAGYTFNGWYTSSSGGSYVGRSGSSYTPTSNTTLYAHWTDNTSSNITYNISYNLNNGTHGSSHPTSATYGSSVNISNPTKKVTINLSKGTTASGATISSSSVSADQTFDGWTAANLNTTTARYGSSSTSINTQWSKGSTKTKSTYFKNLTSTNNATVTLTANWTQKNITLPKITKTGYTCGWATSSSATTITYASGATYAPNAKGNTSVNLYGVCKSNSAPSLKVTFKTSAGYSDYCTSAHTASNGSCTFDKGYYTPLTLTLEATDENPLTKMTFAYNASDQTSYTDVKYTEDVTFVKSGNTYTGTRTIGSAGKRKIKITATNSIGKTSTVIMNINAVKPPFENKYDCTTSVVSSGTIYSWIAGSDCKSTSESRTEKCSEYNGSEYFGIIDQNKSACVKELNWVSENTVRVNAYVPKSAFKTINGDAYLKYNNYKSETYNGITYYYVTFPVWCNQANCGSSGWVINSEARKKICPSIKTKNSAMYNKICK